MQRVTPGTGGVPRQLMQGFADLTCLELGDSEELAGTPAQVCFPKGGCFFRCPRKQGFPPAILSRKEGPPGLHRIRLAL